MFIFSNSPVVSGTPTRTVGDKRSRTTNTACMRAVYLRLTTLAFSFAGCAFFCIRAHVDAPEKFAFVEHWSPPLVPVFLSHSSIFFSSLLPRPRWRARSSVFRFGGETMKSLSPMAIATSVGRIGRNRCIGSFLFPLLFRDLYKYIFFFFFFSICLWFTPGHSRFSPWAWHLWPRRADSDNTPRTRQNFLDTPWAPLITLSFLNFKNYQFHVAKSHYPAHVTK